MLGKELGGNTAEKLFLATFIYCFRTCFYCLRFSQWVYTTFIITSSIWKTKYVQVYHRKYFILS